MQSPNTDTDAPTVPTSLPKYVYEPVEKQELAELRALSTWIDEMIEYRERPVEIETGDDEELVAVEDGDGAGGTEVIKKIPCGKDCEGCPHGPYRYLVHREGGSVVWDYKGPA